MEWTQEDVEPYIAKVESFIGKIEKLFPETTDTTLDSAEVWPSYILLIGRQEGMFGHTPMNKASVSA